MSNIPSASFFHRCINLSLLSKAFPPFSLVADA
jgi:hypothetical protein